MMLIRYRRDRFIEPLSHSRVSLDADIAASAVNPRFLSAADYSPLGTAVLEVKGPADELPPALRALLPLGAQQMLVLEVSGGLCAHDAPPFITTGPHSTCSSS